MSNSPEYIDYLRELLTPLGPIRTRRMFGSVGMYCDELFFAIVASDVLYLKVDEENRAEFEREGLEPFTFESEGVIHTLSYYRVPDEALDSPALMQPWARSALAAALRARNRKPAKKKTTKKTA